MCRFLLCKSKKNIYPQKLLSSFAQLCKKNKAPNGDWQGDGWGINWLDESNNWQSYKSLKPIWIDFQSSAQNFHKSSITKIFAIHARSASSPSKINKINYIQPYSNENYSFVFNGFIKGVKLNLPGDIGSQKIWSQVKSYLKNNEPVEALALINQLLTRKSEDITALNLGLISKNTLSALCKYKNNPNYYSLFYHIGEINIICSEKIENIEFITMNNNQIITL